MSLDLYSELTAAQRAVLAVDTPDKGRAREIAQTARVGGSSLIKIGLELASATSWEQGSVIAGDENLDWVADAKGDDISKTIAGLMRSLVGLDYKPTAITIHAHSGIESMRAAQEIAEEAGVILFGVTELTSVQEKELRESYDFLLTELGLGQVPEGVNLRRLLVHMRARNIAKAGLGGLVTSAKELRDPVKKDPALAGKLTLVPGTRSEGVNTNDQHNVETPRQAIQDGADLLVIGREVTEHKNPPIAYAGIINVIQNGIRARKFENAN